jgi:probable selenium-dependent hydroxylase accessory protein YqeC
LAGNIQINPAENISLSRALGLSPGDIISLVGGGGKSTLMRKLAEELAGLGYKVIATTTTHILPEQTIGWFILEENQTLLLEKARKAIRSNPVLTLASGQEENGKLRGPDPDTIPGFLEFVDFIIIEADGAQRKPLKAPNATEPVIVPRTSIVVAIAGIDGVGKTARDVVFRVEIAGKLAGFSPDDPVTPKAVSILLAHPEGITRTSPPQSRKVAFINKISTEEENGFAVQIAGLLKEHSSFSRVIIGNLEGDNPQIQLIQIKNTGIKYGN